MLQTLIVDDCETFRRSIHQLLAWRFAFMRVAEADSVAQALARAAQVRPDLVFLDIRLPDGSGLELARRLGAVLPCASICVVTSFDLPEYRQAARRCGARHYIEKGGATAAEFAGVVDAVLAERFSVLVVEGDAARERIRRSLARRWPPAMAFDAGDLPDALATAAAVRPALALVPGARLDARWAALPRALKAARPDARLVATGCPPGDRAARDAAALAGADHLVEWPRGPAGELGRIIEPLLAAHHARIPAP